MRRSQGSICVYWTSLFCKIGNDIEGGEALCPSLELSLVYVDGCRKWDYASFSASKVCFKSQPRRFDIRIMRFKAGHGGYYLVNVLTYTPKEFEYTTLWFTLENFTRLLNSENNCGNRFRCILQLSTSISPDHLKGIINGSWKLHS